LLKAAAALENATQGSDLWETSIILLDYRTLTTRQKETSENDGQSFSAEGTHEGSQSCLRSGAVAAAAGLKKWKVSMLHKGGRVPHVEQFTSPAA
jgi:hypothetical protein